MDPESVENLPCFLHLLEQVWPFECDVFDI